MHRNAQILDALTSLCSDMGQTIEQREAECGRESGEIRAWLQPPEGQQVHRNVRLILAWLQFPEDKFIARLTSQSGEGAES
ncbi:hypothetical protein [Hyphomonas sp.]|uniref:hypothetical protein n=1 Tax=Hyphomonas sp. TaxID=87 RepID=UPI003F70F517|tara:strand:- start:7745 stop:7987 length:243 start_codon:yes stop_codon:yes gene_type:complete